MARIIFNLEDGTRIETGLATDNVTIGRHPGSDVVLPSSSVSAHHATIKCQEDAYFVQDHGTTNGTKINGVEVDEAKLEEGDRLSFGDISAVFQLRDLPVKKKIATAPRPEARRSYTAASSSQSLGCSGFFAILAFILMAFVAGVTLAHALKYHRFLLPDIVSSEPAKKFFWKLSGASAGTGGRDSGEAAKEELEK